MHRSARNTRREIGTDRQPTYCHGGKAAPNTCSTVEPMDDQTLCKELLSYGTPGTPEGAAKEDKAACRDDEECTSDEEECTSDEEDETPGGETMDERFARVARAAVGEQLWGEFRAFSRQVMKADREEIEADRVDLLANAIVRILGAPGRGRETQEHTDAYTESLQEQESQAVKKFEAEYCNKNPKNYKDKFARDEWESRYHEELRAYCWSLQGEWHDIANQHQIDVLNRSPLV